MLLDQRTAGDGNGFAVGKDAGNDRQRLFILRKTVNGYKHGAIEDEKISVCRREPVSVVGIAGLGPGKGIQFISMSVEGAQSGKLVREGVKFGIMLVRWVVAGLIEDRLIRGESSEGIDVAVRVIAREITVLQPHDTFCAKVLKQLLFNLSAAEVGIAVGF